MKSAKVLARLRARPGNVKFAELCKAMVAAGFAFDHQRGSHAFYYHAGIHRTMNVQEARGMAKAYQVRQFLDLLDQYGLAVE